MRSSPPPTSASMLLKRPGAIASAPRGLQALDQPVNSPRGRGEIALRDVRAKLAPPSVVSRAKLLHRRAPAARDRQPRRAQIVGICLTFDQLQLLEPRHHSGHVLL